MINLAEIRDFFLCFFFFLVQKYRPITLWVQVNFESVIVPWRFLFLLIPAKFINRVFSLTWSASMQIYWTKRKRLHKKRVQLPKDGFGTPTWPPFHCFSEHQYGLRNVMWKHSIQTPWFNGENPDFRLAKCSPTQQAFQISTQRIRISFSAIRPWLLLISPK